MTREQLQQLRLHVEYGGDEGRNRAIALIDAELQRPEEREWGIFDKRKQNIFSGSREFAESCLRRFPDKYGPVYFRTPAGPWKEAK